MRLPRIEEWSAAGDPKDGVGFITYRRIPIHWWLLERWLAVGPAPGLVVSPAGQDPAYWGDPFCAAYVTVWARFCWSREEDRATVQVGWDNLPETVKAAILERQAEDDEQERVPHFLART